MDRKFTLRKLKASDATLMFEWMHDENVIRYLQNDFLTKTMDDVVCFIDRANNDKENLHLAIVSSADEYMGTVSLKHITEINAEFAIAIRQKAMSTGCSAYAIKKVIEFAFKELNLQEIYWCVSPSNERAIKFYDKNGYERITFEGLTVNKQKSKLPYDKKEIEDYIWYHVMR